jgi:BirA family biotin operon repressor/biotin-[acetyl-CoA-carboxylase] ligase
VILQPDVAWLPYLIMISSLAVVHSIDDVARLEAGIKWPNDILIDGKKVGGIWININIDESEIKGSSVPVTSLEKETRQTVVKTDLVKNLLQEMEWLYLELPHGESIYRKWCDKLATLGKRVVVNMGAETLKGLAESVDSAGALMLRLDDGNIARIVAGDVSLRER